ncbi:hypothetical protein ACJRO7_032995 [Eucalyptus globulus]|uniref:NTF2 domain-containing protein n=1 Tax=Eucalyptus globulus TaxID=34317 RepID=A0ABD3JKT0_EUCGL
MAAFFGGQYYFAFDSSRQYVLQYYGPRSRIDFDGHTAQGLEAIGFVYNAEFLIGVTHHVTEISSSVEPITNQRILTFRGIIRMGGQLRDFHEHFSFSPPTSRGIIPTTGADGPFSDRCLFWRSVLLYFRL